MEGRGPDTRGQNKKVERLTRHANVWYIETGSNCDLLTFACNKPSLYSGVSTGAWGTWPPEFGLAPKLPSTFHTLGLTCHGPIL